MRQVVINCTSPAYAEGLKTLIERMRWSQCEVSINTDLGSQEHTSIQFDGKTLVLLEDPALTRRTFGNTKLECMAVVIKTSSVERLAYALRQMDEGQAYIDPDGLKAEQRADETLTERQAEILQLFADGVKTEAVADALGLSTETIRTHTKRILAKINASTRTEAVAIAIRNGYID